MHPSPTGSALAPAGAGRFDRHPHRLPPPTPRTPPRSLSPETPDPDGTPTTSARPRSSSRARHEYTRSMSSKRRSSDAAARFQRPEKYFNTPSDTVILHNSPRLARAVPIGSVVTRIHSTGTSPGGGFGSLTSTTLTVIGGSFRSGRDGGRNSIVLRAVHFHLGHPGLAVLTPRPGFGSLSWPRDRGSSGPPHTTRACPSPP